MVARKPSTINRPLRGVETCGYVASDRLEARRL